MARDDEARSRLLKVLDDAKTFEELCGGIEAAHSEHAGAVFACALRFVTESDPDGLDAMLQERFAQVLSRMVESTRALHLAGVLEGSPDERP